MANICRNTIAVVGLKEPTDEFVKKLSKVMFDIDLDNTDPAKLGIEGGKLVDPETGKRESELGRLGWPLGVLVPQTPYTKFGLTVPRFRVDWKWHPAAAEVRKASETFPDLLFHVDYFIEPDGPIGEFVVRDGRFLDQVEVRASWYYLFDQLRHPSINLLPRYMGLTLAQQGTSRFEDAIEVVKQLRGILDDPSFVNSPYHQYRNGRQLSATKEALDDVLTRMRDVARELSFEGVFLEEAERPTPLYETDRPTVTLEEQVDALKKELEQAKTADIGAL